MLSDFTTVGCDKPVAVDPEAAIGKATSLEGTDGNLRLGHASI
jgi:hypothetical protein